MVTRFVSYRRSRKAWPGEEEQSRSSESKRKDKQSPKASDGYNKDRDRGRKHKDKGDRQGGGKESKGDDGLKGKPFRPTANQRGPRKSGTGLDARVEEAKRKLADAGGPSDKYKPPQEESYEERMRRLKAKKKGKGISSRWKKKFWACLGMSNSVHIQRPDAKEAVKALCLTQRQLKHLKKKFDEVDLDGSGTMDATEFFGMLGEDRTPLTDELFSLMDLDGSGTIEFDEFVAVLLTYCMYSKDDILRFCFDTFDRDHSNSIDEQEFMALLATVNNGQPMFPGNFTTVLQNFDSNDDGLIDFQEFKVIEQRFPLIFFPAFRLQEQMQKCTLGTYNWRNIHIAVNRQRFKREHRLTHGRDPPVSCASCVLNTIFCRPNHEIDLDVIDSKKPSFTSAQAAADKKKAILEGTGRKKRPSRASNDFDE